MRLLGSLRGQLCGAFPSVVYGEGSSRSRSPKDGSGARSSWGAPSLCGPVWAGMICGAASSAGGSSSPGTVRGHDLQSKVYLVRLSVRFLALIAGAWVGSRQRGSLAAAVVLLALEGERTGIYKPLGGSSAGVPVRRIR